MQSFGQALTIRNEQECDASVVAEESLAPDAIHNKPSFAMNLSNVDLRGSHSFCILYRPRCCSSQTTRLETRDIVVRVVLQGGSIGMTVEVEHLRRVVTDCTEYK